MCEVRLTGLKDKGGSTTGICEDGVEKVIRGEAEGYEGEREDCWKPWAHIVEDPGSRSRRRIVK